MALKCQIHVMYFSATFENVYILRIITFKMFYLLGFFYSTSVHLADMYKQNDNTFLL